VTSVAAQLERGRSKHLLGWCAWRNRDFEEAEKQFRSAIALHELMGNQADMAASMVGLGASCMDLKIDGVQEILEEAIQLAKKSNNQNAYAYGFNYLGNFYRRNKIWDKAIQSFNAAIEIRLVFGEEFVSGVWFNNLAFVYFELQQFLEARAFYLKALKSRDVRDSLHYMRVVVLGNLREIDIRLKNFVEARQALEESIHLASKVSVPILHADSYFWLGELESFENNLPEARNAYAMALEIAKKGDYSSRYASSAARLARLTNNPSLATKSLELSSSPDSHAAVLFTAKDFEGSRAQISKLDDGLEAIRLELDIARATGDRELERETLNRLPL
jgi:tetratricopeptide (TPR) repeat protein